MLFVVAFLYFFKPTTVQVGNQKAKEASRNKEHIPSRVSFLHRDWLISVIGEFIEPITKPD